MTEQEFIKRIDRAIATVDIDGTCCAIVYSFDSPYVRCPVRKAFEEMCKPEKVTGEYWLGIENVTGGYDSDATQFNRVYILEEFKAMVLRDELYKEWKV